MPNSALVAERDGIVTISRWIFNTYVVVDGGAGQSVVVDAGLPSNGTDAVEAIRRHHGASAQAGVIASTHGHSDHVGGVQTVQCAAGGSVMLPARCFDYLAGETARTPGPRQVAKILPVFGDQPFSRAALAEAARSGRSAGYGSSPKMVLPFEPDGALTDGDQLSGAVGWEVVHSPGHTDDSTCLFHADSGTLFSGDAVLTHGGQAWFNPEYTSSSESASTEARLRELNVEHLYPGHGRPIHGSDLMATARSFRTKPAGGFLCAAARGIGSWKV